MGRTGPKNLPSRVKRSGKTTMPRSLGRGGSAPRAKQPRGMNISSMAKRSNAC